MALTLYFRNYPNPKDLKSILLTHIFPSLDIEDNSLSSSLLLRKSTDIIILNRMRNIHADQVLMSIIKFPFSVIIDIH